MTTDTIKDVLSRIVSINKNLTESSLRNLLVASGWENADIEEGVKVFHDYMGSTNLPPSEQQVNVADLKIPTPERTPADKAKVSDSGISLAAEERPITEVAQPAPVVKVVEQAPSPVAVPVSIPSVAVQSEAPITSEMSSVSRPWALIGIDSVLFLVALGLLIYIVTN